MGHVGSIIPVPCPQRQSQLLTILGLWSFCLRRAIWSRCSITKKWGQWPGVSKGFEHLDTSITLLKILPLLGTLLPLLLITCNSFSPVYSSPSNIWLKISGSLIELMNLGDKMPTFPSISTEIIHCISKAATCKSHSISAAPVGIQWLWESNKEQNHRLKTNCRGERNWRIVFWEMWHSLEKRLSNLAAVQSFRLLLWEKKF